ncbi:MAG: HAMP domain-containing histidine kinase [Lachnospiraceae bacterium]|nr:HAMP domain-containing histidine kinase [Lachnospiraceae bacterium]
MKYPVKRIIITILIYIMSTAAGAALIIMLAYNEHRDIVHNMAGNFAEQYIETGSFDDIDLHAFGLLVYDADGNCVCSKKISSVINDYGIPGDEYFQDLYEPKVKKHILAVLSGGQKDGIALIAELNTFASFSGIKVNGNGSTYVFFAIRNIANLTSFLLVFFLAFTVMYAIAAIVINSFSWRTQKYYEMQNIYIANITHDLKSPITSIRALAETMNLEMPEDPIKYHQNFRFIISESIKLEHTVKDILELSSFQNNSKLFTKSNVSVEKMFAEVIEKYRIICDDMFIEFSVPDNLAGLPQVRTNPESMARVLDILLDNAIKFTESEKGRINLSMENESGHIEVKVADNGAGMDKETMQHIFERFYTSDRSHSGKGSGLGLAIAQEIINNLNEKITVKSEPSAGTEFCFTIHC